jgi:hypothetical protein
MLDKGALRRDEKGILDKREYFGEREAKKEKRKTIKRSSLEKNYKI